MLDNVSGAGFYGYNPYGYTKYNDDFIASSYLNNITPAVSEKGSSTQSDNVSFTGSESSKNVSEEIEKTSSSGSILWTLALVGGAFLAGKHFNKLKGLFKNTSVKEAVDGTLEKAKDKVYDVVQTGKNTSVAGASNPITNDMEANVVRNINPQHVNSSTRKVIEEANGSTITAAEQAAYDAEVAFKPMSAKQQNVNNTNNVRNQKQKAELNSVKNNSKGGENLETIAQNLAKSDKAAGQIADGGYLNPANKNTYYTQKGKVTKIVLSNGKEITDPLKVAKHLDKHNIKIEDFAISSNKKLNIAA